MPNLFDINWYQTQTDRVFKDLSEAISHYIRNRAHSMVSPHPLFDVGYYYEQRPDVLQAGQDALAHYCMTGWREGSNPHAGFDTNFYVSQFDNFHEEYLDPLTHYLTKGWRAGFRPNGWFDPNQYVAENPDVLETGTEPFTHFIVQCGRQSTGRGSAAGLPTARADQLRAHWNKTSASQMFDGGRSIGEIYNHLANELSFDPDADTSRVSEVVVGVFVHVFYTELMDEIANLVLRMPCEYRLYVSTDNPEKKRRIEVVLARYDIPSSRTTIKILGQRGFDIGPFVCGFADEIRRHDICLRLHTKRSMHNSPEFGRQWRRFLFRQNAGTTAHVARIVANFQADASLGILVPPHWEGIRDWVGIGDNFTAMQGLLKRLGYALRPSQSIEYPSGSMYWFRGAALKSLLDLNLSLDDFEGNDVRDGTLAHAIERSLLFVAARSGFGWARGARLGRQETAVYEEAARRIREAGAFDDAFYLMRNADVAEAGDDPLYHYLNWGWREGRDPSPTFNTRFYERLMSRQDVTGLDPLTHYVTYGKALGLPTRPAEEVPAYVRVADIYAEYKKAEKGIEYQRETFPLLRESDLKVIAFYFPQFHPFEENDRFWGRGFTEWTNTTKATQKFRGHYQPRLPGELGFCDYRLKAVLERQIELARQYGIHGFCLHHYFFSGKPVMRAPYDLLLENPDLDIPFCLHWANEPWTVRWDGLAREKGVLLDQRHTPEDDVAFFRDIEPALRDRRYIRIDGKPLLVIYRPSLFPDIKATVERWRALCRRSGIADDLYMAVMHTGFEPPMDPTTFGFDAAIEYPPHHLGVEPVNDRLSWFDPGFEGNAYDYVEASEKAIARELPDYRLFRGIMPDWDCTPRRRAPDLFVNCAPEHYEDWLAAIGRQTIGRFPEQEQFVFVNAWNEWAEGAYLEPDRRYGHGYLKATAAAISRSIGPARLKTSPRIIVGAHLFYTDLAPEFIEQFRHVPAGFDVFVTTGHDKRSALQRHLEAALGDVASKITVVGVDNIGRDFAPFVLNFMPVAAGYDYVCWCHSKKSPYAPEYEGWRGYLLDNLFGSPEQVASILEAFENDNELGLLYPTRYAAIDGKVEWGSNYDLTASLLERLGIGISRDTPPVFPTAAMFWFRARALRGILQLGLTPDDFIRHADGPRDPATNMIVDGTISHALERMIGYLCKAAGYDFREYSFTTHARKASTSASQKDVKA